MTKVIELIIILTIGTLVGVYIGIGVSDFFKPTINCEEAIRVAYQLGQEDLVLEVIE
jgi:hypothetical protein